MACDSQVWTPWDCTLDISASSFNYFRGGGNDPFFFCSYSSTLETPSIVIVYLSYFWLIVQLHKCLCWKSAGGWNILLESWRPSRDTLLLPLLTLAAVLISVGVGLESQGLVEHATLSGLPIFYVAVFHVCPQLLLCVLTSGCGSCLFLCVLSHCSVARSCWVELKAFQFYSIDRVIAVLGGTRDTSNFWKNPCIWYHWKTASLLPTPDY